MPNHAQIDTRSREAHCLMAARVEKDPSLRQIAVATLERWLETPSASVPYLLRWRELLLGDLHELLAVMRSDGEAATALRQCTPFGGAPFISHTERFQLIRKYAQARA